jgi:polyvinyl alcohol dehydrogenase (cytochrome)
MRVSVSVAAGICGLAIFAAHAMAQDLGQGPAVGGSPAQGVAAGGRGRGPSAPVEITQHGEQLYQARCATCHEHPTGRIPPREMITVSRSPEYIVQVLTTGAMVQQASGLTNDDKKAIATYLMGRLPLVAEEVNPMANRCTRAPTPLSLNGSPWIGWGGVGTSNTRYQPDPGLKASEIPKLKLKWVFALPGTTSSQASIVGNRIFVPTMSGTLLSLDKESGCAYWTTDVGAPIRTAPSVARLAGNKFAVLVSDNKGEALALDANTGKILWRTKVEDHLWVRMTGAPTVYQNRVYVPVSSFEENVRSSPDYPCCTFRGSVAVLDVGTGKMIYKAYTLDDPPKLLADGRRTGPAGVAVWSAPTIDPDRQLMYVGTGNSYTEPDPPAADAVIAMDLATGAKKWVSQVTPIDNFAIPCAANAPPTCRPRSLDYDLGSSPLLVTMPGGKQILGVTSKSGEVIGMDLANQGKIMWRTKVGRGGAMGGIEWGGASDGQRIYASVSDTGGGGTDPATPGLYAMSPADGTLLWSAPSPKGACAWGPQQCSNAYYSAPVVIPGAVFAGSFDGHERAYAADDGRLLWDFDTGHSFDAVDGGKANGGSIDQGGQTIAGGTLLVLSGARNGYPGNALLAFSVDGK